MDWLLCELRVDARRPEEHQALDTVLDSSVHDVHLDLQVLAEEVVRVGVVREDPADLRSRQHDVLRALLSEEVEHRSAVLQVQLGGRPAHEVGEALGLEPPLDRGAHEPAVAAM